MVSCFVAFAFIAAFEAIIYGEILTFNTDSAPDIIECTDGSTDCVINCMTYRICKSKQIHCHRTSTTSICKINVIDELSAQNAIIYTHHSPSVEMNVQGWYGCVNCTIYAHEQIGSKLYIYVPGTLGMLYTALYTPVGKGK